MLKKIMQKANAKKKDQKGFTLIELLAVIVILAILAAIAIPSVISIIHNQSDKAKVQDALTVIHAAKLYVADNQITSNKTGDADGLKAAQLSKYIDDNNLDIGTYRVDVTINSTTNKATYEITCNLPGDATSATEQALIAFNKSGTSLP